MPIDSSVFGAGNANVCLGQKLSRSMVAEGLTALLNHRDIRPILDVPSRIAPQPVQRHENWLRARLD